jgi:hypothetical protein
MLKCSYTIEKHQKHHGGFYYDKRIVLYNRGLVEGAMEAKKELRNFLGMEK